MNFFRLIILFTVFSLLVSCGASSLYNSSHYWDTRLGDNLFRVTFRGGEHPMSGELCLLRCAELCRESGYTHFEIVDSETGSSLRNAPSLYPFHRHYIQDDPFFSDVPFVAKTIRLRNSPPEGGFAYEAREIEASLKRKYEINE
jgi:hypothetical protein